MVRSLIWDIFYFSRKEKEPFSFSPSSQLLNSLTESRDRRFGKEVLQGTARNIYFLEAILRNLGSQKRLPKLKVRSLLVIAIYEVIFLNTPEYALISETRKTAIKGGLKKREVKFVEGVLRKVYREKKFYAWEGEYFSTLPLWQRFSIPEWVLNRWNLDISSSDGINILKTLQCKSCIFCWPYRERYKEWKVFLESKDFQGELFTEILGGEGGFFKEWCDSLKKLLSEGIVYVQAYNQKQAINCCPATEGDKVLEVGAAPGGKTWTLVEKVGFQGTIFSLDISEKRLNLLSDKVKELGYGKVVTPILGDGRFFKPEKEVFYDHVVLDIPCSNSGEFIRRPEVRWRILEEDLASLETLQEDIFKNCWNLLKVGGSFLFCSCSLFESENHIFKKLLKEDEYSLIEEVIHWPDKFCSSGGYYSLLKKK